MPWLIQHQMLWHLWPVSQRHQIPNNPVHVSCISGHQKQDTKPGRAHLSDGSHGEAALRTSWQCHSDCLGAAQPGREPEWGEQTMWWCPWGSPKCLCCCKEEVALQGSGFCCHLLGTEGDRVWFNRGKNNSVFYVERESDGEWKAVSHGETAG